MTHSIKTLRTLGAIVYAVDKDPLAPGLALADDSAVIDVVDTEGIIAYGRKINADLIMVVNGAGVISGALASAALKLPGLPVEVAIRSQDKGLSRECWKAAGLRQPDYRIVKHRSDYFQAVEDLKLPLVVKPCTRWGSRGVALIRRSSEIDWALAFSEFVDDRTAIIVEKAIEGLELSVEGLVRNGEVSVLAVGDKEMQEHPQFRIGMALNYPARIPAAASDAVEQLVDKAVHALGIINGAFDAEIMLSADGPYLLEINPRPGGGHIFGTIVEAVSGINMPQAYAKILLGFETAFKAKFQRGACYRFFGPPSGVFQSISGLEQARRSEGVLDAGFTLAAGSRCGAFAADADRPGFVVAQGSTREAAMEFAKKAVEKIKFQMYPDAEGGLA